MTSGAPSEHDPKQIITWPGPTGLPIYARIPAHIQPYVEAVGIEKAAIFLRTFGGAPIYLARKPQARSRVAKAIGFDAAVALSDAFATGHIRVPTSPEFLTRVMRSKGMSVYEIARQLHYTDMTIRKYLRPGSLRTQSPEASPATAKKRRP